MVDQFLHHGVERFAHVTGHLERRDEPAAVDMAGLVGVGPALVLKSVIAGEVDQAHGLFLGREPLTDAFAAAAPDIVPTYMGLRYLTANASSPKATPLAYSIRCI